MLRKSAEFWNVSETAMEQIKKPNLLLNPV
jgi:hypothetical protein